MFLKQMKTKTGRVRLAIYESYWDGGRSRQRVVRPLGFLDELKKEHEDPVAWGRAIAAEMNAERDEARQTVMIPIHPAQMIDKRQESVRDLGSVVAYCAYSALGVEQAIRSATRGSRASFDVNALMRLLVMERIVCPGSKMSAWQNRGRHFFRSEISDDDLYRGLDLIAKARDSVVSAMNRRVEAASMRDSSLVYYDVTNYYFETERTDGLRRKGVSKERRRDPIVQMGLLQDARAIPIAYRLFPGNTNDCLTMLPVLADMKRDLGVERVVCVADKGLNTSDNIIALCARGDGFVLSQSVRGTKSGGALRDWVLDPKGYAGNDEFRMKSAQGVKRVTVKACDSHTGKRVEEEVPVKYVAFWSRKYEARAREKRRDVIEKAMDLVANPGNYTRATSCGAAKYVRNIAFDKKTGEVCEGRAPSIDEEAIAAEEAQDGYYLIVTSETGWDDERIVDTYRELWRIEESFRVTKSEIEARPVWVWTPAHIEAHFLTCYVALFILRVLQHLSGLPASVIRDEISKLGCTSADANWWVAFHRTDASDTLVDAVGLPELKLKYVRTSDVKKLIARAKQFELPQAK